MKVPMGPPPPLNKNPIDDYSNPTTTSSTSVDEIQKTPTESNPGAASAPMKVPMGPPPPKFSNEVSTNQNTAIQVEQQQQQLEKQEEPQLNKKPVPEESNRKATPHDSITIPYTIPPWNHTPPHPYSLEVLKEGLIIDNYNVTEKGAYMFGRVDLCDFVLEHPTISRFHAVLQFKQGGEAYIYDLGSTHGTFVNKTQVKKKVYTELHVGDVIRFGNSSRLYIFQGPSDLMPAESDLRKIRRAKIHEEIQDREASLLRAKKEASLADGISWGMGEDAIEEVEEDTDEVTWQTYKGQLTERQEKTRDKIIKRTEKITNMKKEIDAIRVKDIAQGGLTQGQQTQIARNEQRMSQILEELESLEETLNESIQESIGARTGKFRGKKKVVIEEDDEISDDDEFYDRTKKPAIQKGSEHQSVETADSLLDKKEVIMKEIEDKKNLLLQEETRILPETDCGADGDDALDAYMTGLSSQMKHETAMQLQKGLSTLQSELDKILYLLKIADPSGEASKKRNAKLQTPKANQLDISSGPKKCPPTEIKKSIASERSTDGSSREESPPEATAPVIKLPEVGKDVKVAVKSEVPVYVPTKPQWLGDVHDIETKENQREAPLDAQEPDDFVDYKDRKAALVSEKNVEPSVESGIEGAAPGLIIRKRKQIERPEGNEDNVSEQSTSESAEAEATAADAVALLLKHERGYLMPDREEQNESLPSRVQTKKKKAKSKRVLGPERPVFLDGTPEYESWVPPKGQSGDGRTSLNERYGY